MKAILGKKIGMTQVFNADGTVTPVTVVEAGPCVVTQIKNIQKDGYNAIQIGYGNIKPIHVNKARAGHFKKAGVESKKYLQEIRLDDVSGYKIGSEIKCDIFAIGDRIDAIGTSKGHGFSGSIARWNTHRLKMTHGVGPVHREVGSLGSISTPSRVFKNKKMAGQWGNEQVTIQNLSIVKVDAERNLLLVKGSIPGADKGLVRISTSVKA